MMLREIEGAFRPQEALAREDLFVAASSFEPRSMNLGRLWIPRSIRNSLIFRYADTLDIELGRTHTKVLAETLRSKSDRMEVVDCSFSDPYSVVRALMRWRRGVSGELGPIDHVSVDASCFTKLQLLLLLRALRAEFPGGRIRIGYTEPQLYASSYRRPLSYGVSNTFYLPYVTPSVPAGQSALFLFLGHELLRAEKVVDELEPEVTVLIHGEPGFSREMVSTSEKKNRVLLSKVRYDHQYKLMSGSSHDFEDAAGKILGLMRDYKKKGFGSFYFAPLGTKLQCIAFDILSRVCREERILLAYSMPRRYERKYYSQGVGRSWEWTCPDDLVIEPIDMVEVAGVYYSDPFQIPYSGRHALSKEELERAKEILLSRWRLELLRVAENQDWKRAVLANGRIERVFAEEEEIDPEWLHRVQSGSGRQAFCVRRQEVDALASP